MKHKQNLEEYIREVMNKKRLKAVDVMRRSGGTFSDAYVGKILSGIAGDITVDKLQALAKGLGVSEDEIFDIARGVKQENASDLFGLDSMNLSKKYRQLNENNKDRIDVLMDVVDREMDRLIEEQIEAPADLTKQKKRA